MPARLASPACRPATPARHPPLSRTCRLCFCMLLCLPGLLPGPPRLHLPLTCSQTISTARPCTAWRHLHPQAAACRPSTRTTRKYYLIENREEMEALADAVLVAEGVSMPVHSQVSTYMKAGHGVISTAQLKSARGMRHVFGTRHVSVNPHYPAGAEHAVGRAAAHVCGLPGA